MVIFDYYLTPDENLIKVLFLVGKYHDSCIVVVVIVLLLCLHICLHTMCVPSANGDQKRVSDPLNWSYRGL